MSDLSKNATPVQELADSKVTNTEKRAQNVNTNLNWNGGTKLSDNTNWSSSQWSSFGYDGSFDIPLKDLVAGNQIVIGDFTADSNNGQYMFFQGDGGSHWINFTDPDTKQEVTAVGHLYFNQGGYRTGKIIFQIDKTIFNDDDPDKADKLINFNFDIKDFVILNYFTDCHIF